MDIADFVFGYELKRPVDAESAMERRRLVKNHQSLALSSVSVPLTNRASPVSR